MDTGMELNLNSITIWLLNISFLVTKIRLLTAEGVNAHSLQSFHEQI